MFLTKGMPRGHLAVLLISYGLLGGAALYAMMSDMRFAEALIGAIVFMMIVTPMLLAGLAKAPAKVVELPKHRMALESTLAPDVVFEKLAGLKFGKVAPHDADAGRRVVVLSSPSHFYAIFAHGSGAGSMVMVGITPKSIDTEKGLQNALESCAAEIKKALAA